MNTTLTRNPDLGKTLPPHADTADIKKTIERAIAQVETARAYVGQIDDDLYSDNNTLIHSVTAMVGVERKLAELLRATESAQTGELVDAAFEAHSTVWLINKSLHGETTDKPELRPLCFAIMALNVAEDLLLSVIAQQEAIEYATKH